MLRLAHDPGIYRLADKPSLVDVDRVLPTGSVRIEGTEAPLDAAMEYFEGHSAGNSVLGTKESITALSCDEMRSYFNRRYIPSNMVLVAAGNVDFKQFVADAERYCGSWQNGSTGRELKPFAARSIERVYRRKNLNQALIMFVTESCSAQSEDRYPLDVLGCIVGDGVGSKLYWELVDKGLAESAGAQNDEGDGVGCFMAHASTEVERIDEVAAIIRRILTSAADFSDDDLTRAKNKLIADVVLDGELSMGRLMSLGVEWDCRRKLHQLGDVVERFRSVCRRDIEEALSRYPLTTWSEFRLLP
jgi:predicted Zn-dependent peptidase